jgi:hypothetical protein
MTNSIGSGLAGFVGIGAESAYGTVATPTDFVEVRSSKIVRKKHFVQGTGLAAGRVVDPFARYRNTWTDCSGPIEFEWLNTGMGLLLTHIMGSPDATPTVTSEGSGAYGLACPLGANDGMSLSIQEGLPQTDGTIDPYTALGCKVQEVEFTCERGGLLTVTLTIDGQTLVQTTALGEPTYGAAAQPFDGSQVAVKVAAMGDTPAAVDGVKKWTLKIARKLATERIYMGATLKAQPVSNGIIEITGSFDVDFVDTVVKAAFDDMLAGDSPLSANIAGIGAAIGTSDQFDTLSFDVPSLMLTDGTPELPGPEVLSSTFNFKAGMDAAADAGVTATWISADTTL